MNAQIKLQSDDALQARAERLQDFINGCFDAARSACSQLAKSIIEKHTDKLNAAIKYATSKTISRELLDEIEALKMAITNTDKQIAELQRIKESYAREIDCKTKAAYTTMVSATAALEAATENYNKVRKQGRHDLRSARSKIFGSKYHRYVNDLNRVVERLARRAANKSDNYGTQELANELDQRAANKAAIAALPFTLPAMLAKKR